MDDLFIEKIVARKKTAQDYFVYASLIVGGILIMLFIVPIIPIIKKLPLIAAVGIIYGIYYLIRSRNLEYEYAMTNGDLDIDVIIAQRKRKRLFSGNCKEFEIVAPAGSDKAGQYTVNIQRKILALSAIDSPNAYFFVANYNNERVMVFFEPDDRMLDSLRTYIPSKLLRS